MNLSFEEGRQALANAQVQSMWPALLDPCTAPKTLHHYTNALGLQGILTSKSLWASDCHFLNDLSELTHGHNLIDEYLKKQDGPVAKALLRGMPKDKEEGVIYATSFCENGDLLSQWRGYSHAEDGYSIAFQFPSVAASKNVFLTKIVYDLQEQRGTLAQLLDSMCLVFSQIDLPSHQTTALIQLATEIFWSMSFSFKHECFQEEHEWRLVGGIASQYVERFRVAGGHFVPFIEIPYDPSSLIEIRQGPGLYRSSNVSALRRLLKMEKFVWTNIEKSAIPL